LTIFWASVFDTVRAQKSTVPVALTPKVLDDGGVVPDGELLEEHPAAASSAAAAAPVSARLLKSFIALASLVKGAGMLRRANPRDDARQRRT
jgi:hypothetical protein